MGGKGTGRGGEGMREGGRGWGKDKGYNTMTQHLPRNSYKTSLAVSDEKG